MLEKIQSQFESMKYLAYALSAVLLLNSCEPGNRKQEQPVLEKESQEDKIKPDVPDTAFVNGDSAKKARLEDLILDIRNEFHRINAMALVATKHSFICDTDGIITYYTSKGKVVKIGIDWGFVGDGSTKSEYYYKDDKLIFEYEVFIGAPAGLPDSRMEQRIYVNNDKTLRFMRDQEVISCRKCEFGPDSHEYKALRAYKTGNFKAALCN